MPGPGQRRVPGTPRQEGHSPRRAGEGSTLCSRRGLFLGRHSSGNERFYGSAASRGLCWSLSTMPLSLSRACVSVWDCPRLSHVLLGRKGCLSNCISRFHRPVLRCALTEISPWCFNSVLSFTSFLGFVFPYPSIHQFHLSVCTQRPRDA